MGWLKGLFDINVITDTKQQTNDLAVAPQLMLHEYGAATPINHEWAMDNDYNIIVSAILVGTVQVKQGYSMIYPDTKNSNNIRSINQTESAIGEGIDMLAGIEKPLVLTAPQGIIFHAENGLGPVSLRVLYYKIPRYK